MQINNVSLTVKVKGRPVAEYQHEGRVFVEGKEGSAYSLHIRNDNSFTVKVVPSIDGVNVVSGKPATGTPEEIGYVLSPHQSFTCDGYRLDNDSVASFTFTKASSSYAKADKGMGGTTGVIGLRVWKEKVVVPPPHPQTVIEHHYHDNWWGWGWNWPTWKPYWYGSAMGTAYGDGNNILLCNNSAGSDPSSSITYNCSVGDIDSGSKLKACSMTRSANTATFQTAGEVQLDENPFTLGSTFGEKVQSRVTNTTFETDYLLGELTIYYSTGAGLEALGVDISRKDKVAFPQAFEGEYCRPPVGWKG